MKKEEFLIKLKQSLKSFSKEEIAGVISYYDEIIAERVEQGQDEDQIIKDLGEIKNITKDIQIELLTTRVNKSDNNLHKISNTFFIVLMLFASPALLPIGIVLFIAFFTVVIVSASLLITCAAITLGLIASLIPTIISLSSSPASAVAAAGVILLGVGISGLLTILFIYVTKWILNGIAKLSTLIVRKVNKKEAK